MKTVDINKKNVIAAFQSADKNGKKLLSDLFGKDVVSGNITDRIKTFEDACAELGIDKPVIAVSIENNSCNGITRSDMKAVDALMQLTLIIRALNEGWTPDWKDQNQVKYYVWLTDYKSGSGFSRSSYGNSYTHSAVGSQLCFKSEELAEYAGVQFRELYNQYFNL